MVAKLNQTLLNLENVIPVAYIIAINCKRQLSRLIPKLAEFKQENRKIVDSMNKICYFRTHARVTKWREHVLAFDSESRELKGSIDLSQSLRSINLEKSTRMV